MAGKRDKPEEIVAKLRQVEVHGQGVAMADAIRRIGVSEVTYYRWRKQYGGMKTSPLKQLKALERENECGNCTLKAPTNAISCAMIRGRDRQVRPCG